MSKPLLPSPKLATGSRTDRSRLWYRFYAMFSEDFAAQAIEHAQLAPRSVVLDSWLGAGTTATVAATAGHKAVGADINPVMIAVSAGRTLSRQQAAKGLRAMAQRIPPRPERCEAGDPLTRWFTIGAASSLRALQRHIEESCPSRSLERERGFALTALFDAARELAASAVSKNPTWIKFLAGSERIKASHTVICDLWQSKMSTRVELCLPKPVKFKPRLSTGNSASLAIGNRTVDFVLTSPPYCTRIDYVVMTAIELAVLGFSHTSYAALRDKTMGTSTIRASIPRVEWEWGKTCVRTLEEIRQHPSKASNTYYFKNFVQYFSDLHLSFLEINRCLRRGGQAVFVVQDSLYKGIRIDLARVCTEMASGLNWEVQSTAKYASPRSMRRVNTRSRRYHSELDSSETVIWFRKPH
jgi:SAM-dependent methyltransferase